MSGAGEAGGGPRQRIVMLVDNGVRGDSRVQKQARSAAEAGWDVILLGRAPRTTGERWELGGATVRLLPVESALRRRRHEFRRAPLRSPLAYPPGRLPVYRSHKIKAWRAALATERAWLTVSAGGRFRPVTALRRLSLLVRRTAARVMSAWVGLRVRKTEALRKRQREMTAPLDRATTRFWQLTMGDRAWRRLDPGLWDYELAYGRVLDALKPDLIHANDFRMLGVGARAAIRARAAGRPVKLVWDAHEFLPGIKPWDGHPRWHAAQCAHEREYSRHADAVVTVSDTLADMLVERHGLPEPPAVVLNAPSVADTVGTDEPVPDIRALCGVDADTPLAVYSGAAAPQRGLDVMVEALPALDGVHVAFVVLKESAPYVQSLVARAAELGVAERVHVLPYVPHHQVVRFLAGADIGVIPIHHWPNHEIALITKYFEYSHARLPLVVSDVKTMAGVTRSTGQGEVFRAEDTEDYARAVKTVLADRGGYRAVYDDPELLSAWTWEAQADVLHGVYRRLLAGRDD